MITVFHADTLIRLRYADMMPPCRRRRLRFAHLQLLLHAVSPRLYAKAAERIAVSPPFSAAYDDDFAARRREMPLFRCCCAAADAC